MKPMTRTLCLLCCLTAALAVAGPKKKSPPKKAKPAATLAAETAIKQALDGAQAEVGGCVVNGAPDGAWKQTAKVKVILDGKGQVMDLSTSLEPANANEAKTRACIDAALRKLTWPQTHAPLTTVEREWAFSME